MLALAIASSSIKSDHPQTSLTHNSVHASLPHLFLSCAIAWVTRQNSKQCFLFQLGGCLLAS